MKLSQYNNGSTGKPNQIVSRSSSMPAQRNGLVLDKGRPLPKFGEWDVNNPASSEGFTVIFSKARDEKKTSGTAGSGISPQRNDNTPKQEENFQNPPAV
ncbi:hypothetical protein L1049_003262 [Liquidambar formosana]|uniref:RIN4 pathogenic type III effector avirulence factor Avr cleavage site domain-containing protein n=1 Tax=Liquidambar formosana TaxID=63359 RepID=A0AAP0NH58_LIQFO